MAIQVSEALDLDTAVLVSLENASGGSYVEGIYVPGATVLDRALASVQQPSPKELEFLEGGERGKDLKSFYLNKEVITSQGDKVATVITHRSKRYKVVFVGDWEDYGYFFAIGAKI
tara:strand:- start:874 stop:1221 length:348 start_codon:yes stop_codon:yes gene_type:complete